jgi:hypothetical protein
MTRQSYRTVVYLKKSTKPDKKYMVYVVDTSGSTKVIHFGARGMSDFTKHKDVSRMKRYSARHRPNSSKTRGSETWSKSGIKTAGFWSKWLLWNKPSLAASKKSISSKFRVTFKSGWPSKGTKSKSTKRKKSIRINRSRR